MQRVKSVHNLILLQIASDIKNGWKSQNTPGIYRTKNPSSPQNIHTPKTPRSRKKEQEVDCIDAQVYRRKEKPLLRYL
ncbi:hypothetical protein HYFRA_00010407 [Hymenoscyphus fraxineus]|uniref:Uncharacterized protein n=1 Tax=Hymenoscyphus fraxineus TaxID=746836 RepID=A0A9N9L2S0_9HELO|nr:hypothetical protein HYFRA_00010407 [Hymenoscyphus fraxineus]